VGLHGWGVVCGLKVIPHPYCPALRIVIEPGLAIDGCGREILVPQRVERSLPVPSPLVIEDPCPSDDPTSDERERQSDEPYEEQTPDQPTSRLYVCLRYKECGAEPMPAPFNECACGSGGTTPNRICEGYEIETFTDEPECFELVRKEKEAWESQ